MLAERLPSIAFACVACRDSEPLVAEHYLPDARLKGATRGAIDGRQMTEPCYD